MHIIMYLDNEINEQYEGFKKCNYCEEVKQKLNDLISKHNFYVIVRSGPPHYEIYQNVYHLNNNMLKSHINKDYMERRRFY